MAIAVAMCMWMVSYSAGMYGQIYDVLIDQKLGHVQVHHPDYPGRKVMHDTLEGGEELLAGLEALPGSTAVTGRLTAYGLIGSDETSAGGKLLGVDPARENAVTHLDERVRQGRMFAAGVPGEAVIGVGLADELEVGVDGTVVVIGQAADGSMANDLYTIVGVAKTGDAAMDRGGLWIDLPAAQELLALQDQLHEVLVLGEDIETADALATEVRGVTGEGPLVRTWTETDPQAAQMQAFQAIGIVIMLGIFYGVSALGILNTMLMAVFERTRELGLLQALGLKPSLIRRMVLAESFMLALLACGVGGVIGGLIHWHMVTKGMEFAVNGEGMEFMGIHLDPVIYGESDPVGFGLTLGLVFVVSVGAAIWPAFRATLMNPVDAMRQA